MSRVRIYAYVNDGDLYMKVVSDTSLFDRYESFLTRYRQVRYDYVDVVDGAVISCNDNDGVVAELEDFGY